MVKNIPILLFFLLSIIHLSSCNTTTKEQKAAGDEVLVFAAASLTDVLSEIIDVYQKENQVKIKLNLASSGTLARQIEQGASVDIYISANARWSSYIDSLGYMVKGLKSKVAGNALVLIAPSASDIDSLELNKVIQLDDLLGDHYLSIGDPSHVPAGKYALQTLQYYGWTNDLKAKILPAKDVRSALMMVELGEAPLGIVYLTDALKSSKVKVIGLFPDQSHQSIDYIAGVCSDNPSTRQFYCFLSSDKAKQIWLKYGFQ